MKVEEILAGIDQEIARLQHARNLLAGDQPRRGRPRGSTVREKGSKGSQGSKAAVAKSGNSLPRAANALQTPCGSAGQSARRQPQESST